MKDSLEGLLFNVADPLVQADRFSWHIDCGIVNPLLVIYVDVITH